jgi:protein SCO1/2
MQNPNYILFILLCLLAFGCGDTEFNGTEIPPNLPTTDFRLTDQYGQAFSLSGIKGQVAVVFFGFTYCPDICPTTLSKWAQVEKALGEEAKDVKFVYITVDPQRDSPEIMAEHLKTYSPDFVGLTGDSTALQNVYDSYGIIREKVQVSESATGYLINHTARFYVFDKTGRWRLTIRNDATVEELTHDIKLLLKENIET